MNILYYPYINLPNTEWTIRALLYYDTSALSYRLNISLNLSDMSLS